MIRYILVCIALLLPTTLVAEDLVLVGGTIIDGTGKIRFKGNVRIKDGRITDVGVFRLLPTEPKLDVTGLIVAPGFIDVHNHSAEAIAQELGAPTQVAQGITTMGLGPDGGGPFGVEDAMAIFDEMPPSVNLLTFVGHATVRVRIMGGDYKRKATPDEVQRMAQLVEQGMREGAFGLSSGLEYDPGFYADTSELVELCKVVSKYGGIYMSHIRDESYDVVGAINEAITVGREAKVPVQISHIKLGTTGVWGKTAQVLAAIDKARVQGVDVTADLYPYTAWSSSITVLVPSRKFDDTAEVTRALADVGGAKNVLITRSEKHPEYNFKTLEDVATSRGMTAVDLYKEIVKEGGASIVCTSMTEADVKAFMRHRQVMISSDGGIGARHPRGAGTFPRVLGKYVRAEKVLTLEAAIRKMTSMPAARLGFKERGVLRKGAVADVVVFNAQEIVDRSTFQEPMVPAVGMKHVLVNGVLVMKDGQVTDARPGQALR